MRAVEVVVVAPCRDQVAGMAEAGELVLVQMALIDWQVFELEWTEFFPLGKWRPTTEPRLVAGLLYLQHACRLSDEAVVAPAGSKTHTINTSPGRRASSIFRRLTHRD